MIILSPHAGVEISQSVCTGVSGVGDSGSQGSAQPGRHGTRPGASLPFPRQLRGLGHQRWTGLLISRDTGTEKMRGRRRRKLQVASRPESCLPGTEIRGGGRFEEARGSLGGRRGQSPACRPPCYGDGDFSPSGVWLPVFQSLPCDSVLRTRRRHARRVSVWEARVAGALVHHDPGHKPTRPEGDRRVVWSSADRSTALRTGGRAAPEGTTFWGGRRLGREAGARQSIAWLWVLWIPATRNRPQRFLRSAKRSFRNSSSCFWARYHVQGLL